MVCPVLSRHARAFPNRVHTFTVFFTTNTGYLNMKIESFVEKYLKDNDIWMFTVLNLVYIVVVW